MFKEALKEVVDRTDGAMAALLMDASGIALESYSKNDAAFDVNNIGIEFSVVLSSVKRASEMLETGAAAEVTISSEKLITVLRCIGDTYFVALAVAPTSATASITRGDSTRTSAPIGTANTAMPAEK